MKPSLPLALVLSAAVIGCVDLSRPPLPPPVLADAAGDIARPPTAADAGSPEAPPSPIPEPAGADAGAADTPAPDADIDTVDTGTSDIPSIDTTAEPPVDTNPPVDATPPAALVLYWTFDDGTGAIAADASGRGFHGSYLGAAGAPSRSTEAAPVAFANPASRQFDGASRHAVLLDPMPAAVNPTAELTLAVWYQATAVDPVGGGAELISLGNNQLLRLRTADIEVSKRALRPEGWEEHVRCFAPVSGHLDGAWHHVAVVIDRTAVRLYFDGVQRCLLADANPLTYDLGNELWIGRHPTSASYDFSGQLDDVRIYDQALPPAEVAALAARRP